ncbi:MAG: PEP-CTERM sorting domain-containing protein [Kaiparowitsia implicata GSE-PSE-MK54-09C]|jgi:hypothetical protein|nr:PEP-CTERM sorting domain-containing protein [Kaiparowitsia implicata GSE-PSE-MK54-09C]
MNTKKLWAIAGLALSSTFALLAAPVQAAGISFSPFIFSNTFTGNDPKGDIWLDSVSYGDRTVTDFSLVQTANIIQNDLWTKGNTGAASADRGDNASGVKAENPTSNNIAAALGNLNLNNIVDTEDTGSFIIDVMFSSAISEFFFWERGMNSKLMVQAMGEGDTVLASFLLNSNQGSGFTDAGFSLDTAEIGSAQKVGALGLFLDGASTNRLRLISESSYNGADFKVAGAQAVPEPATMAGTALAVGALVSARRKKRNEKQA